MEAKSKKQETVPRKRSGHTTPRIPITPLNQPGRMRIAHWLAILGVSHSTFVNGVKSGRYPPPDGHDGAIPFWQNSTALGYLNNSVGSDA